MTVALQTGVQWHHFDSPQVEVIAPLGVAFDKDEVSLRDGELRCSVLAASNTTARNCTVGYVAELADGSYKNGTARVEKQWRGRGEKRAQVTLQLGSSVRRVTLLLRLGPHLVDTEICEDTSPRVAGLALRAYEVSDPEFCHLIHNLTQTDEQAKRGKERVQRLFENGVAQLFSMAGFVASVLASADAVDVLVQTSDETVFMPVECTLGALNARDGKPNRLAARTDALRRALGPSTAEILPVMATSRFRTAVSGGDLEFAAHDRLSVLCRDDLLDLLRFISRGARTSDVVLFCRERIPLSAVDEMRPKHPLG